jgi:predicted nucleotidyltransferase
VDAFDDVLRVVAALNSSGVEHVVIGGVGLNVHGIIRATEDLDLFIRPDAGKALRSAFDFDEEES